MLQAISHTAKPLSYYVSSPCIDALISEFGPYLEQVSPLQKCFLGSVFFDFIAGGSETYRIQDSLDYLDSDCLLGEDLTEFAIYAAENLSQASLAQFLIGLAALLADDIRNQN